MFYGSRSIFIALAVWTMTLAADDDLERLFNNPPADAARPCLALSLTDLSRERDGASRQLSQARALGFGSVLLRVPVADESTWTHLVLLADTCRRLGMEMGVCDFGLATEPPVTSHVQRLVWSVEHAPTAGGGGGAVCPTLRSDSSYRELACLGVPATGEVLPYQIVDLKTGVLGTNGEWRVYRFGCSDTDPALPDCFNGDSVFRHLNSVLFACQTRMPRTYGTTLVWYQMRGPGRKEVVWPSDLPDLFLKQSGLNLLKHLPALAGVPVGGAQTAAYVRQQVAQAVSSEWRQRFARNANELVHEAGLEAGIAVEESLIPPEETALYFHRPTLPVGRTPAQRIANIHAAGGARALARRFVMGTLNCACVAPTPAEALLPFPYKHEIDRLLSDGATRLIFDGVGGLPEEGERFSQLRALCRYVQRCQMFLQHGEAVADFVVWSDDFPPALAGYSCDFASRRMLERTQVRDRKIRFESERAYARLAVTADVVSERAAEHLVRQLAGEGVEVWLVPPGESGEKATFSAFSGLAKCSVLGAAGVTNPVPDVVWQSDVVSVDVRFLHRRTASRDVYFLANVSATGGPVTCLFRDVRGGAASRWDPASGETGQELESVALPDGRRRVALFMAPHDACFVVFGDKAS